jgi:hypothetical protein
MRRAPGTFNVGETPRLTPYRFGFRDTGVPASERGTA